MYYNTSHVQNKQIKIMAENMSFVSEFHQWHVSEQQEKHQWGTRKVSEGFMLMTWRCENYQKQKQKKAICGSTWVGTGPEYMTL